jgi:hypothetical protein
MPAPEYFVDTNILLYAAVTGKTMAGCGCWIRFERLDRENEKGRKRKMEGEENGK